MNHKIQTRGDTVYCGQCGRQWDIHDEMPVDCTRPPPSFGQLHAFLVGPQSPNTNPSLVFAHGFDSAARAMTVVTGIHQQDLIVARAPAMDGYCKVRTACPSFNPADLERAAQLCADVLADYFPGATAVVSPFKHKADKR